MHPWCRFRRRQHLTQRQLARLLGVHVVTVWRLEQERTRPRRKMMQRLQILQHQQERQQRSFDWS